MRQSAVIRDLLFVLFILYYAQGSLYASGSILSQGALAAILIISSFYLIKTIILKKNKNTFYKVWTALLTINVIGFIFTGTLSDVNHFGMLKGILVCSLSFYPFYYFSQNGNLKARHLLVFFVMLLPITILQFYLNASQILLDRISDSTDVVNNVSYSFVALIPFVFLLKNKRIISFGFMMILVFFIIQGAKRGALIAGAIGLLSFVYFQLRTIERRKRFKGYFIISIAIVSMSVYAYNIYETNEFLIDRMQGLAEGNSSGRDIIYLNILNAWYNSTSYINILFGYGFAASLYLSGTGNFAHNDWLELLSNYGLLGVSIYIMLFYSAIKEIINSTWTKDKQIFLITILLIWLFVSLVSMTYTSVNGYIQAILLAFLIGSREKSVE